MSEKNGVCVIVPRGQKGFRPQVFGMGILIHPREVVTCAHVIDAALGSAWQNSSTPAIVSICFPFADADVCREGAIDRNRLRAASGSDGQSPSDIAVIQLTEDAPTSVEQALLRRHTIGNPAKAYGFRGSETEGSWRSHPFGEWASGKIVGPQPGGRVQFDGLRVTGASVEKGFSGGAVYDTEQGAVVGMIVEADRDKGKRIAQFIDIPALQTVLGIEKIPDSRWKAFVIAGLALIASLAFVLRDPPWSGIGCVLTATVTWTSPSKPLFLEIVSGDHKERLSVDNGEPVAIQLSSEQLSRFSLSLKWPTDSTSEFGEFSGCSSELKSSGDGVAQIKLTRP